MLKDILLAQLLVKDHPNLALFMIKDLPVLKELDLDRVVFEMATTTLTYELVKIVIERLLLHYELKECEVAWTDTPFKESRNSFGSGFSAGVHYQKGLCND